MTLLGQVKCDFAWVAQGLVAAAVALATTGCGSEPVQSENIAEQSGTLLFEMPYSDTGSISIYELEDQTLLVKSSGVIDVDDPARVQELLALDSFPAIYSKINAGKPAPAELVDLDARYQEGLARFVASDAFQSRQAPESPLILGKSQASFMSTVCNKTFGDGGAYRYRPAVCCYWAPTYLVSTLGNDETFERDDYDGADAYDWIFGWNDSNTGGYAQLFWYDQYNHVQWSSKCTFAPYTWGHCSWGGTFTGRYASMWNPDNYASALGLTVHERYTVVR